jgi:ribosome-binding protein aMBF1 (putative translation factor)
MKKRKFKSGALQHAYDRYVGDDPRRIESFEEELLNARIARQLHNLRVQAGISQRELADKIGTSPSAISRLENTNYRGHSLSMLQRVAAALGSGIEVNFVVDKSRVKV